MAQRGHAVLSVERSAQGLRIKTASGTLSLEPWSDRIVHVRYARDAGWRGGYNPAVIAPPRTIAWTVNDSAAKVELSMPALRVVVDKASGAVAFLDAAGKPVVAESGASQLPPPGGGALSQSFGMGEEAIYGLGQHQNGLLDYRGSSGRSLTRSSPVTAT